MSVGFFSGKNPIRKSFYFLHFFLLLFKSEVQHRWKNCVPLSKLLWRDNIFNAIDKNSLLLSSRFNLGTLRCPETPLYEINFVVSQSNVNFTTKNVCKILYNCNDKHWNMNCQTTFKWNEFAWRTYDCFKNFTSTKTFVDRAVRLLEFRINEKNT